MSKPSAAACEQGWVACAVCQDALAGKNGLLGSVSAGSFLKAARSGGTGRACGAAHICLGVEGALQRCRAPWSLR